jgi:DNA-binding MarR family transcriptional regulator
VRRFAKPLSGVTCFEGSNPSLSATPHVPSNPFVSTPVSVTLLRHPGSSISGLAEHHGVGLTTASALADRLVRQGLLDRQPAPAERRRLMLSLTALGGQRLDAAVARTRNAMASVLAGRTPDELAHIEAAMGALRDAFTTTTLEDVPRP